MALGASLLDVVGSLFDALCLVFVTHGVPRSLSDANPHTHTYLKLKEPFSNLHKTLSESSRNT